MKFKIFKFKPVEFNQERRNVSAFLFKGAVTAVFVAPIFGALASCNTNPVYSTSPGTTLTTIFQSKTLEKAGLNDDSKDLKLENLNLSFRYLGIEPHIRDPSLDAAVILVMQANGSYYQKIWITKEFIYNDSSFDDPKNPGHNSTYRLTLLNLDSNSAEVQLLHTQA